MRIRLLTTPTVVLLITLLPCVPSHANGYIYIYRQPNGGVLFTDQKVDKSAYKLLRQMGRPTATKSCIGVTPTMLKQRAKHYQLRIERLASTYHLDPLLIRAIITVESCYDPHATSTVGARGLMQLMPATAAQLGYRHLYKPSDNLQAGMQYFSSLLVQFSNNVKLALAAYNAGPKAVIRYGGIPPFSETQSYVIKVMKRYRTLLDETMERNGNDLASQIAH